MSVLIETSRGDLVVDLFCDEAPIAARNFLRLCKCVFPFANKSLMRFVGGTKKDIEKKKQWMTEKKKQDQFFFSKPRLTKIKIKIKIKSKNRLKYYNNTLFHRIVPGLVAQAGDPTGTGRGGSCAEG